MDPTGEFFDRLGRRRHEPRLERVSGTIRFDIAHARRIDHWFVEIEDGDLSVSRDSRDADCVVQIDKAVFDRVVTGETSPVTAWLRNQVTIRGDLTLLRLFERLSPGPTGARDPRHVRTAPAPTPEPAEAGDEEATAIAEELVSILDGNTFLVSDGRGDIEASPTFPTGLFSFDTRYLSTWRLSINGQRLHALSVDDLQYFETRFFLVPGAPTHYIDAKVSVIRQRSIGGSFDEQLTVLNHENKPVDLQVRVDVGSDFADLFEIKDAQRKRGRHYTLVENGHLRLGYERESFRREAVISSTELAQIDEQGLTFDVHLERQGSWTTRLHLAALGHDGRDIRATLQGKGPRGKREMRQVLDSWLDQAPKLRSDYQPLTMTYHRSLVDLAALQYRPMTVGGQTLPAAGLPWFMTTFGRDSILTSLQALPFTPDLAATTLRALAIGVGRKLDDFRDEEPGKVFHELRFGESSAFEEQPHSPYYGTADATPLWLVLLDEYERWTGDDSLIRRLEPEARGCLTWIDTYADALGNGYIWYQRRNTTNGLENQCWKDSWDSISYHDGRLPPLPRATCELQGYAYDAKRRAARLARQFWNDPGYAEQLEREAADLKERFNRDFWIEDGEYYALALDPDGRQVDALASNIGHLLWSGIVPPDRAKQLANHLLGPKLFSGWGVRTLATDAGRYNPVGYHVGTVWPFDNSFIAWGLRRYGFAEEAGRIAERVIDAAQYFRGRLPEAFAGYDRELTKYPVQYPTACSPQAWSAGAVLLFLRTMLGLESHDDHLVIKPALPRTIGRIELLDIPGRWGPADAFGRSRLKELGAADREVPGVQDAGEP
ncbi:glycogen debranching N-terminal domain-containing protein [Micromonospora globispora]|uniref:glycogen debranching N-terminal domain-containing protein n=1 Tax=Micromonospora globispora TaxID=1450148 RepID=UPI001401C623|nr:glycogen debranching N-terminal domain-containing protein [Micromonospora globispora]